MSACGCWFCVLCDYLVPKGNCDYGRIVVPIYAPPFMLKGACLLTTVRPSGCVFVHSEGGGFICGHVDCMLKGGGGACLFLLSPDYEKTWISRVSKRGTSVSHPSSVLPQELGFRLVQGCFGIAFPGGLASPLPPPLREQKPSGTGAAGGGAVSSLAPPPPTPASPLAQPAVTSRGSQPEPPAPGAREVLPVTPVSSSPFPRRVRVPAARSRCRRPPSPPWCPRSPW